MSEDELHEILSEVDLAKNAQVDMGEYMQVRSQLGLSTCMIQFECVRCGYY